MNLYLLAFGLLLIPFAAVPLVWRGAPFVPSSARKLSAFLDGLKLDKKGTFVDLGSGTGSSLAMANKEYRMRGLGVELNPFLWLISKLRFAANKSISVARADMWSYELPKDTSVIFIFALPKYMEDLHEKIQHKITRPVLVVVYAFEIPGQTPLKQHEGFMAYKIEPAQQGKK